MKHMKRTPPADHPSCLQTHMDNKKTAPAAKEPFILFIYEAFDLRYKASSFRFFSIVKAAINVSKPLVIIR